MTELPHRITMLDPRVIDPAEEIVQRNNLTDQEVDQIVELMEALRLWMEAERRMSETSRRYMRLGESDMKALRFMIAAHHNGVTVTPRAIAEHLHISTASTTKLLDRLEAGDHVKRVPNPKDRRSIVVEVNQTTRHVARETVGKNHAQRFTVAAQLTGAERETVTRFLRNLAETEESHQDQAK